MKTATKDDELGMAWWNSLTERERAKWSAAAGNTGVAKDAWEAFKKSTPSMPACNGQGRGGAC